MPQDRDPSKYLYTSGSQEEWDLPLFDDGNEGISVSKVATYAALLSPRGLRGKKIAGIADEVKAEMKSRLLKIYREVLGKQDQEIPFFILHPEMQYKSFYYQTPPTEIEQVEETEFKGVRGLLINGLFSDWESDHFRDTVLQTDMLRASTVRYFETNGQVLFEHGLDPEVRRVIIGKAYDHAFEAKGIRAYDFLPEPGSNAPDALKRRYAGIMGGEFAGFSGGGLFFRDTGEARPPGYIVDWELDEHSVCKIPVNPRAMFVVETELKSDTSDNLVIEAITENIVAPQATPEQLSDKQSPAEPETEKKSMAVEMSEEMITQLQEQVASLMKERNDAAAAQAETEMKSKAAVEAARIVEEQLKAEAAQRQAFSAAVEAEVKALSSKMSTGLALGMQLTGGAARSQNFNAPMLNGLSVGGTGWANPVNPQSFGPTGRMKMSGISVEHKALRDDDGNLIPGKMIDWLDGVKHGRFYDNRPEAKSFAANGGRGHFDNGGAAPATYDVGSDTEVKTMTPGSIVSAANSPVGSAGGFVLPPSYLNDIVPYLTDQGSIRDYVTVMEASALVMEVPIDTAPVTRASVVAPGATKPVVDFGTDLVEIRQYVLPLIVNITNQLLRHSRGTAEQFLRKKLIAAIRLAEFYYALSGTGTGQPKGVLTSLEAANTADATKFFKITRGAGTRPDGVAVLVGETVPDAIARAINATENRFFSPTAVMMHNNDFWNLQQLKDSQQRYILNPNVTGPVAMSIWNIPFVRTTLIPSGTGVMGDWRELYMYIGDNLLLDSSSEAGDRFDTNRTGFRIEEEMGLNADQNIRAFTELIFT